MDLHEGSICVYSEGMGYGSTFSIELPIIVNQPLEFDINNKIIFGINNNSNTSTDVIIPEDDNNNNNNNNNMNFNESESTKLSPLVTLNRQISNSSIVESESEHVNASIKALIVDDSSMNRKMVRRLLEMKGNDVDEYDDDDN